MNVLKGVVYMMNNRGPTTDPRGTPPKDVQWKTRKDLNQLTELRTEPPIPSHDGRRVIKMLWLIVSKAADRT